MALAAVPLTTDGTITDAQLVERSRIVQPLAAGAMLGGRYQLRRFIAAGGMGEVYDAADTLLGGDPVAVKLLRADLIRKPGAQSRFADEIRLARKITHANVCRVFDVGVDGERVFYTMQLHSGLTLARHLAGSRRLALPEVGSIARQMLDGIGAAHDAEVVHADLKPSNVLLTGRDATTVVITDFGLAAPLCAPLECRCAMPHLVGTPAYMAPEQVTGDDLAEGTDLFAFGVIMFEMVTGHLPWLCSTPVATAQARLTGDVPSPLAEGAAITPRWNDVIRALLARDPAARPTSAADVARSLDLGPAQPPPPAADTRSHDPSG